jgi:peptidoglycan biosynthesis protein MviN/MurJ (putative lipid II flippase)
MLTEVVLASVVLFHSTATVSGVGPPLVTSKFAGGAVLVPTANYPAGHAVVVCNECKTVFDVHRRTKQQRKVARRADQRQFMRWAGMVCAAALCSGVLAAVYAYVQGGESQLQEAWLDGGWLISSITVAVLSLACFLFVPLLMRTPELEHKARTKAGLHTVGFGDDEKE